MNRLIQLYICFVFDFIFKTESDTDSPEVGMLLYTI